MFKNKRTVAIQVISLAAAVLLLFSALPLFTAGSDSQKAGATCATAGKSAAQPVNAGNTAISGTVGAPSDYCGTTEYNAEKKAKKRAQPRVDGAS